MDKRRIYHFIELNREILILENMIGEEKKRRGVPDIDNACFPDEDSLCQLYEMKRKREEEYREILHYIEEIDDPLIRKIISVKFRPGKKVSWNQASFKIYGRADKGDSLRIKFNRFLEEN